MKMRKRKRKKRKTLPVSLLPSALQALPPGISPLAQGTKQAHKYSSLLALPSGHASVDHEPKQAHRHEAPRTQASAGREVPCPSSNPKDLRVKHGEDGPLPQVTWRHIIWSIANPPPPVFVPGSLPPRPRRWRICYQWGLPRLVLKQRSLKLLKILP